MTRLCFLDTETTSLAPDRQAWEVGMILRVDSPDGDRVERDIQFYVDVDLDRADLTSLGIGRFWDRHPMGRYLAEREPEFTWSGPGMPRPGESPNFLTRGAAALTVARWTIGAHIVGAVPDFDMTGTLDPLLRAHGLCPAWHYHLICAENLAAGFLSARGENGEPPWNSSDLSTRMGIDVEKYDRHTALGDAQWARDLYDAVMNAGER